MTDCCLQCDCDACLNTGGGTVYAGQGVTHATEPMAGLLKHAEPHVLLDERAAQAAQRERHPDVQRRVHAKRRDKRAARREQNQRAAAKRKLKQAGLAPLENP